MGKGLLVDVIAIEQGAIDRVGGRQLVYHLWKVTIYYMYVRETAHRGLYHFRVIGICRVLATVDGVNAKPVGNTDDGAQVPWILYAVEGQG